MDEGLETPAETGASGDERGSSVALWVVVILVFLLIALLPAKRFGAVAGRGHSTQPAVAARGPGGEGR